MIHFNNKPANPASQPAENVGHPQDEHHLRDQQPNRTVDIQQAWHNIFRFQQTPTVTGRLITENVRENQAWGHPLQEKNPQHTRIYCVNINGLTLDRDGGKFDEYCQILNEVQGDVGCIQEHNLDTTQHHIKSQLYATAQRRWQWFKMAVASTPIRFASSYKPGGTMMISANSISSRMTDMSSDKWGRWTSQTFQGKQNIRVTMFSVYQVVDSRSAMQGPNTAASQQQALLLESNENGAIDPRYAFCRDLKASINQYQSQGHDILVTGDFNEVLGNIDQGGITQLASECQLTDVMSALHPGIAHPATYMRGHKRLDYVLASPRVLAAARRSGYEEFQHRIHSDHRAYFVDLVHKLYLVHHYRS